MVLAFTAIVGGNTRSVYTLISRLNGSYIARLAYYDTVYLLPGGLDRQKHVPGTIRYVWEGWRVKRTKKFGSKQFIYIGPDKIMEIRSSSITDRSIPAWWFPRSFSEGRYIPDLSWSTALRMNVPGRYYTSFTLPGEGLVIYIHTWSVAHIQYMWQILLCLVSYMLQILDAAQHTYNYQ